MLDVESARTDARCHQDVPHPVLEVLNCELSVSLVHASVQDKRLISDLEQLFEQLVSLNLLLDEDQDASFIVPFAKEFNQLPQLVLFRL